MAEMTQPTAAVLVIGDEILNGRTADRNIHWLAGFFYDRGIRLAEARVIGDDEAVIIESVKVLSARYDMVFTTGGIGPTHDDITTASVAKAFSVNVCRNAEAERRLLAHYAGTGIDYNQARQKMADIPEGAELIDNPVSAAPGFRLGNVFVLAGVPSILQAMALNLTLPSGVQNHRLTVQTDMGEGTLAAGLAVIEADHDGVSVGSYPWFKPGVYGTAVVVSGLDAAAVHAAAQAVLGLLDSLGGTGFLDDKTTGGNT